MEILFNSKEGFNLKIVFQKFLEGEMDVMVSMEEAKAQLKGLIVDRKTLTKEKVQLEKVESESTFENM